MSGNEKPGEQQQKHIEDLYQNWFLDYASYVILERAVPLAADGLKPVQRRILYSMKRLDDGRFHKVANIIGHTMQFHPHGDAAIGEALVNLGQKNLLIDTQGNWGDVDTGDRAAAPRYIEARPTKFALAVVFNEETTVWQSSYDGRNKEPVALPVKFPLLLAQGCEGIAVGLATKILPHNFIELIDASISLLQGERREILPDFPGGGIADCSNYQQGQKGGKVRVRAQIDIVEDRLLLIREIPYGTTTGGVIDSIIKANDNGKIKIRKVVDNTAKNVEIRVELPGGVAAKTAIDGLYAFTDCEISLSANGCVIIDNKPCFSSVDELLALSTRNTKALLQRELEIKLADLQEKQHFLSMEKIFIAQRIYRVIEECESWEQALAAIGDELRPFAGELPREIRDTDIARLAEIKIRRISRYNLVKAEQAMVSLNREIAVVGDDLANLDRYAIDYFRALKEKYGAGRERKTRIARFETIQVAQVAMANQKLYVNCKEGFIGYGLKKDELVEECSDLDDIIIFLRNGSFKVVRIDEKVFVGKNIIHAAVWNKNDKLRVYNLIYRDGQSGKTYAKRFVVTAITHDRDYDLTQGTPNSRVLYFSVNPYGETEVVSVHLHPGCQAKNKQLNFDFAAIAVKGRSSQGNTVTRYPVSRIVHKSKASGGYQLEVWYDRDSRHLNNDGHGQYLGRFTGDDLVLTVSAAGAYQLHSFELGKVTEDDLAYIGKYDEQQIISAVYYDGNKQHHFVKRFQIETQTQGKTFRFISDHPESKLVLISTEARPCIKLVCEKKRPRRREEQVLDLSEFIEVKGWKAGGNRLCFFEVVAITPITTVASEEPKPEEPAKSPSEDLESSAKMPTAADQSEKNEEGAATANGKQSYVQSSFLDF